MFVELLASSVIAPRVVRALGERYLKVQRLIRLIGFPTSSADTHASNIDPGKIGHKLIVRDHGLF